MEVWTMTRQWKIARKFLRRESIPVVMLNFNKPAEIVMG